MQDKSGMGKIAIAVVLIAFAVVMTIRGRDSFRTSEVAATMNCACTACDWSGELEIEERPGKCPECKESTVWPALLCTKCGNHQPVDLLVFNAQGREPYCTECNHPRLTKIE